MPISVKMTSDFICPWCLIGKARLFRAIETLPAGIEVEVEWLPFELNPEMPKEGMDRKVYRSRKFGSWERSQALDAHSIAVSKADGVVFDYDNITRTPNTFSAHRLSWLAAREGRQRAVAEGILNGYFGQGRDIGDTEVLTDIACEAGLDRETVCQFFKHEDGIEAVRALQAGAYEKGVQGVPHFDIEGTILAGARSPESLRQVILDAHARKAGAVSSSDFTLRPSPVRPRG